MARAGLGPQWECRLANDFDAAKGAAYSKRWGGKELIIGDVNDLRSEDFRGFAELAWASFPCQDLSLAGNGAGLHGTRSGAFWGFWRQMETLRREHRAPAMIVLENVTGALSANEGSDFRLLMETLVRGGYRVGAMVIDAVHFLPQSRPRLFLFAVLNDLIIPSSLSSEKPCEAWHPRHLVTAHAMLSDESRERWIWWKLPMPSARTIRLMDLIEDPPLGVEWHSRAETERLLGMMSPIHREKVEAAQASGVPAVGAIYKRTRVESGIRRQRAEIRFDDIAGCLRTPGGGSSRQVLLFTEGRKVRSRLLSTREAARLMGLPEDYPMPTRYNDGYHLAGDGVAVPVVRHLAAYLLEPILLAQADVAREVA